MTGVSAKSLDAVSEETGAFECGLPRTVVLSNGDYFGQVVAGVKGVSRSLCA
jgi:hypothetical protein